MSRELSGKIFKRRENPFAQTFKRRVIGWQGLTPFFAAPAEFKRGIFDPVNFGFFNAGKSSLERGKPVVVLPIEGGRPKRATGEFGQRVMGDGFAAVQEKRDAIPSKLACQ